MSRSRNAPLKYTVLFLVAGCLWIAFSDALLSRYVHNLDLLTQLSIAKGWLFMVCTAGYLYWLVYRYMGALWDSEQALIQRNRELTTIEENLRCSHNQFVMLVNSIEGIVWECDALSFNFKFVSKKAEEILGYAVGDWLTHRSFWKDRTYPDDREMVWETLCSATREKQDHCLEHRMIAADGRVVWMHNNITIVEEDNRLSLRGVMYDITIQKSAEQELNKLNAELEQRVTERTSQLEEANQELQAIFSALPDMFFRMDGDGVILDYKKENIPNFLALPRDLTGRRLQDLLPDAAVEQFHEALTCVRLSKGMTSFEFIRVEEDSDRSFEVRLLPFRETEIIVLVRDITARRRAEEEIRFLNDDLQRRAYQLQVINQELESFSYSVSHDLRTPLRHIDGFSKALQEDCSDQLNDEGKMYVNRVRMAAQRMGQLIDDLLKLANVTSSDLIRQRVDVSAIARAVVRELEQSQPDRSVTVSVADHAETYGDPRLLRVVLTNLLGNAWKYTGFRADAVIEFGTGAVDGEEFFFVRDNGAGFDMAYASKLFQAFQRLHGVEEFEGSGIGLATVQRVIRRHGGKVWGEGEVGKGATFCFTIGQHMEKEGIWQKS